ncbi:MAG: tripartite tricarboxylate transporter substrate binding protein [Usitatibacter sp.]
MTRRAAFALALAVAVFAAPVDAQEWTPTKTVRIIVPIVGGTNDVVARLVAPELAKAFGRPVVVENKGGGGGNIGADLVAKSPPDGYTLLVGYNGPIAINPTLFANLPYDPLKDLAPITLAVTAPQFLAVHPSVPVKNVAEFVAYAKANPGKLSYASVAIGSASHLTMEMLKSRAPIDLVHVPYKGSSPAVVDLIGGQVSAAFFVPGNILEFVKDGRAKAIASTGQRRFAATPEVATMIEQGYPDFLAETWIGFLAPGGTPKPIIDRYNREIVRILHMPEVRAKLDAMQMELVAGTPEQFAQWIRSEIPRWGKVIKDTGATAQ